MTEKEAKLFKYNSKFQQASQFLATKYKKRFSNEFLSALLGHHFERDDVHTFLIFNETLDQIDLALILDAQVQSVIGQVEFNSDDFDFILIDNLQKAVIKDNGYQWIIYKYDIDPFPSNPHAHEFKLNVKLHLGTGDMYRKKAKIGSLRKNEFERLKKKILSKGIQLPN